MVKNLPAMQETWVQSLDWEDLLEKEKATHSSILAWRFPRTVESMRSQRVGHNWGTFTFTFMSIESMMPSNHLILCCPLLLFPLIFPSIRVFSNESALPTRWTKYWSFHFCFPYWKLSWCGVLEVWISKITLLYCSKFKYQSESSNHSLIMRMKSLIFKHKQTYLWTLPCSAFTTNHIPTKSLFPQRELL